MAFTHGKDGTARLTALDLLKNGVEVVRQTPRSPRQALERTTKGVFDDGPAAFCDDIGEANHLVAVIFRCKNLQRWLNDTPTETLCAIK